jgi:predicted RNase H-like HicB family nuclease
MKYKVNIKKTEEGYSVWCPGLPGCWSQGHTEEEALGNIKDAITSYLDAVEELNKGEESRFVEVG